MGYQTQKPVYKDVCVQTERQVVGWETVDEAIELSALEIDASLTDFVVDSYYKPPAGLGIPQVLLTPVPPTQASEVPAPAAWAFYATCLVLLVIFWKAYR